MDTYHFSSVREALFNTLRKERCSQGPERLGHRNLDHLRAGKGKPPRPDQSKQQCRIRPPLALKEFTRGHQLSQKKGRSAAYCSRKETSDLYYSRPRIFLISFPSIQKYFFYTEMFRSWLKKGERGEPWGTLKS